MNINTNSIILLDDNKEYVVASKVELEGTYYIYILEINNPKNYKFAEIEDDGISVIEPFEKDLLHKLIPLFGIDAKKVFDELMEE